MILNEIRPRFSRRGATRDDRSTRYRPVRLALRAAGTGESGSASADDQYVRAGVNGAEADSVCGAEYGVRSEERTNTRNGNRRRLCDTRAGTIELAISKLRSGSYFPDWLLERRPGVLRPMFDAEDADASRNGQRSGLSYEASGGAGRTGDLDRDRRNGSEDGPCRLRTGRFARCCDASAGRARSPRC